MIGIQASLIAMFGIFAAVDYVAAGMDPGPRSDPVGR